MTHLPAIDDCDAFAVADRLLEAAMAMRETAGRQGSLVRIEGEGRLLVTGDIHDNPRNYAKIIDHAGLDSDPEAHLVLQELIHGERLVDGVDLSYRMLLKASTLLLAHPGRVHLLLANHELAQMAGHSVSKGNGCMTTRFDEGLARVFDVEAERVAAAVAEFVRSMPLAARTDRGVLCAHSLPGREMVHGFDVDILGRDLEEADYEPFRGSAWKMVWGRL